MKCDKCNCFIEKGEEAKHLNQILCEDCYSDVLSPVKTCDPWAVYTAQSMVTADSILTSLPRSSLPNI